MNSIKIHNLGYPRIGKNRELKKAVEAYWKAESTEAELQEVASQLRQAQWQAQSQLDYMPVNDFSLYDQMLDMSFLLGVVPERIRDSSSTELEKYFATARGNSCSCASEMTKWFNTNYHYIVPEISDATEFKISSTKIFDEFRQASTSKARPVIIGPVTYLALSATEKDVDYLKYLSQILPVYVEILSRLADSGAEWVQIDEPIFSLDLSVEQRQALIETYEKLSVAGPKVLLVNYFGELGENLELFFSLPVHGFHIDAVEAPAEVGKAVDFLPQGAILSLGVLDGKNIWRSDYRQILDLVKPVVDVLGTVWLAPSCSLLHVPHSLEGESKLDSEIKSWLAFADEKLQELCDIKDLLTNKLGCDHILFDNQQVIKSKQIHEKVVVERVRREQQKLQRQDFERQASFEERQKSQQLKLQLPLLPTTTIGSFPQTKEIRQNRAAFKKGKKTYEQYEAFLKQEVCSVIEQQIEIGLDILVHGEPERNDMVEYFGEQLEGFTFTANGWVQSYGSRCVKPPIIFGDVWRPEPMTVKWSQLAQEIAGDKPMKGMLTGPVTMLKWSFVRNDISLSDVAQQIGLALRQEILDLESAGIEIIQVDEPAIREGLPLKNDQKDNYLDWAVDAFKLSTSGVNDSTQIHTHMCYSDFNEIIEAVAALDADVISVETSRSQQALLNVFKEFRYPNEIGPGVYDIHSPRIPSVEEIKASIEAALNYVDAERLWVNPDCGLKTRAWPETKAALLNMIEATQKVREELKVLV
ncbi:MAG: 5-methyltetrahydropteroyltriglutamate--homocysteine S-methyltransferase [Lentisphaerales bacterium]|nr:5-methyltetrahydropteroyltriglutamate--homocysteine S-methyltransferase [Lentisphaerales bacterium]